MSNNAHDLSKRLLNALDNSYNVVDMHAVNEIISILERFNITKELLETTRLGKHVNELRRKTTDPTLARRAKVLVKRWRDLVIPGATSSPAHTGVPVSNRSSAERTRRLGGTPLTSPALARQVVSPAVNSPRPTSRPAWGGYESDSQDVIVVVDDDPPPPLAAPPVAPPKSNSTSKRPLSPAALVPDEKKAKRDKKPKKKRGHSRAGSGSEAAAEGWTTRNGTSPPAAPAPLAAPAPVTSAPVTPAPVTPAPVTSVRKNGCRKPPDAYSAMVNRMPAVGAKKVKTTKELLEEIQSRGTKQPPAPASPGSPDVMLIEPEPAPPAELKCPLRNGASPPPPPPPPPSPPPRAPLPPLEEPRAREVCSCGELPDPHCRAAGPPAEVTPLHVLALHHAYLPGVNGTRAPPQPHRYAVRPATDPRKPGLFNSVVPLYKYCDYADDYCVKNMSRVPLCPHLPWTEFAPDPPSLPPPPPPHELRPYPTEPAEVKLEAEGTEGDDSSEENSRSILIGMGPDVEQEISKFECPKIEPEMVTVPELEPSDRLRPRLFDEEETSASEIKKEASVPTEFKTEQQEHRTVERTKEKPEKPPAFEADGSAICALCSDTRDAIPYEYAQVSATPVVTLPLDIVEATDVLESSLIGVVENTERDDMGRPVRPTNFTEWHECAQLGDLIALPYVVID